MVINRDFSKKLYHFYYVIGCVMLTGIGIKFIYFLVDFHFSRGRPFNLLLTTVGLVLSAIGISALLSLIRHNALTRIVNGNDPQNRKIAASVLLDKFGTHFDGDKPLYKMYTNSGLVSWGKRVIILADQKDLLINISRFKDGDLKSPFHYFTDALLIWSINRTIRSASTKVQQTP